MADFAYTRPKRDLGRGTLNLHTGGDDIRIALCMQATDCDTLKTAAVLSDFALDEYDGANYVRKSFANEIFNEDQGNDRGEFDADDVVWTALGAGASNIAGALIFKFVTNDADSIPLFWVESGGISGFNGNTGNFTIQWNAEGIAQITQG
jgi:hypothetical protein